MITLSKGQVLMLHERLIEATGGSAGICDEGIEREKGKIYEAG